MSYHPDICKTDCQYAFCSNRCLRPNHCRCPPRRRYARTMAHQLTRSPTLRLWAIIAASCVHRPNAQKKPLSERGPGVPLECMNNNARQHARAKAAARYAEVFGRPAPWGFQHVRIHDLKHTFCRRLRAAGIGEENAQGITRPQKRGHHDSLLDGRACGVNHRGEQDRSESRHAGDHAAEGCRGKKSFR